MSEQKEKDQTPTSDDNILTRHKHIAESIEMIRVKKDQLLQTLRGLSTSENPDRALMAKLVEAFDMMTAQENAFLGVLKNIVVEDDEEMIKETLKELEQVSLKALAAAELNEKLVETLQRHKKSRTSMLELRRNKTEELKNAATAAVAEVKKAKQEVSLNRAEIQKKQKEAEELRKAALKAGIQVGAEEEKHKAQVNAALTAIANDVERIPPIPIVEESQAEEKQHEDPLEARRRQIRENVRKERERREHVNQVIKEKLLAMEARKQRMKEIRRLLAENQAAASSILLETKKKIEAASSADEASKPQSNGDAESCSEAKVSADENGAAAAPDEDSPREEVDGNRAESQPTEEEEQTRRDIEETFRSAEANLLNLTMLRRRLEEIQERGGELTQEDAELIGQLDEGTNGEKEEATNEEKQDENKEVRQQMSFLLYIHVSVHHLMSRMSLTFALCRGSIHANFHLQKKSPQVATFDANDIIPSPAQRIRSPDDADHTDSQFSQARHDNHTDAVEKRTVGEQQDMMGPRRLEQAVSGTMHRVLSILDQSELLDEETQKRCGRAVVLEYTMSYHSNINFCSAKTLLRLVKMKRKLRRAREVVVSSAAALFPNVPPMLIDAQLGPVVADVIATYSERPSADVLDELCTEIVRVLGSELGFFCLINTLNCIPDPTNGVESN
ncbi:hypothetical protein NECAME_03878 [Necator americanus]|uniref:Uncharacterized protein n=1 Tax=Necator americanus TaxID=51031 RepID=W2SZC1_NECAM|nr:hypothetical protein NECAME_03878 [Necator americanus]ETN74963.1 hypothetical protein NECAME_03878 [Necator americanus]